ncbi:hypothetical protein pb186bvf_000183 [Paramecium bursaria]
MKSSLHQILSTKSYFDFSSGVLVNKNEDISSQTFYKPQVTKPKTYPPKTIRTPKQQVLRPNHWSVMTPSNRPLILLNTLIGDAYNSEFSRTNYSNWQTTSQKLVPHTGSPNNRKKSFMLIKYPQVEQPGIGYYNPQQNINKIKGKVKLHKQQSQSIPLISNSITREQSPDNDISPKNFEPIKISAEQMSKQIDIEHNIIRSRYQFQPKVQDLENHSFKQSIVTFNNFKQKWKILKDSRV